MLDIKSVELRSEKEIMSTWASKDKIIVSVLCATYNHESYIGDAITGFLMQVTDFAFEIIIHDDASVDETATIIKKYQKEYPSIIKPIFQSDNQYSQGNKPGLIMHGVTQGKYYALCEGDDYWLDPNKLQIQYDYLETHENIILCGHNSTVINEVNELIYPDRWLHKGHKDLMTPCLMYHKPNYTPVFIKYYSKIKNGDMALRYFLSLHGDMDFLDFIGSAYRVHDGGIWSKKSHEERVLMSNHSFQLLFEWVIEENRHKLIPEILKRKMQKQFLLMFIYLRKFQVVSGLNTFKILVCQIFNNKVKINILTKLYWILIALKRALLSKVTY